jgi:hypothetical protein
MSELTAAEDRVANAIQDYLLAHGGDSTTEPSTSPTGDGRWVPLTEIFPRNAQGNADRQTALRLHTQGLLRSREIACFGGCVKAVPAERVPEVEQDPKENYRAWLAPFVDQDAR